MKPEASKKQKEQIKMTVFAKNLKRLRLAKNLTQEQVAQALGVSTQTVSRWECDTTLPDVLLLPQIAALYCVTIDELYRENSIVYENYAMRLLAVFEASHKPEDFMQAYIEYQKLLKSGQYCANDLRSYGILLQYMMEVCRDKAEETFNRVIKNGPAEDPDTYWSTQRQKCYFLGELGRNQETIDTFLPLVEAGSKELQEWICLIQAYSLDHDFEKGWAYLQRAQCIFPESTFLHNYAGDLLRSMKRYEEAFVRWKRALEMEPRWLDSAYAMGFCYEEMGEYGKAVEVFSQIADTMVARGFEAEVAFPRSLAENCRKKMT
jgi:transcriptional regulator with XRE-family HTH domain